MVYYLLENDEIEMLPHLDMTEDDLCEILDGSVKVTELCNGVTMYTNDSGEELGFPVTVKVDGEDIYGSCILSVSNKIELDDLSSLIDIEISDS